MIWPVRPARAPPHALQRLRFATEETYVYSLKNRGLLLKNQDLLLKVIDHSVVIIIIISLRINPLGARGFAQCPQSPARNWSCLSVWRTPLIRGFKLGIV
jgi:hypothetical protein